MCVPIGIGILYPEKVVMGECVNHAHHVGDELFEIIQLVYTCIVHVVGLDEK